MKADNCRDVGQLYCISLIFVSHGIQGYIEKPLRWALNLGQAMKYICPISPNTTIIH